MIRRPSFLRTFFSLGTGDIQTLSPGSGATAGNLPGLTTGGAISAGHIGELITSNLVQGSAVALSTGIPATITSISVTAGVWDLWGQIDFLAGGPTTVTNLYSSFSTVTNTQGTFPGGSGIGTDGLAQIYDTVNFVTMGNTGIYTQSVGPTALLLSSTTTIFLVCAAFFGAAALSGFGTIRARRVG